MEYYVILLNTWMVKQYSEIMLGNFLQKAFGQKIQSRWKLTNKSTSSKYIFQVH